MGKLTLSFLESLWMDEKGGLHIVRMDGGTVGLHWRLLANNPDPLPPITFTSRHNTHQGLCPFAGCLGNGDA
jgi:hypothetical protein